MQALPVGEGRMVCKNRYDTAFPKRNENLADAGKPAPCVAQFLPHAGSAGTKAVSSQP